MMIATSMTDLYLKAADAIDSAIPDLMAVVESHPVPTCGVVARMQSCICTMRERAGWLRGMSARKQDVTGGAS